MVAHSFGKVGFLAAAVEYNPNILCKGGIKRITNLSRGSLK